ncbi:MAG: hypothetical protein ACI81R_000233 [Bradymonadia bacterium]|jgi:hypothetical protein
MKTFMRTNSPLFLLCAAACFMLAIGCVSGGESGEGGAGEDGGSGDVDALTDAGPDVPTDAVTDTEVDIPIGPAPCIPGTRRCAIDGANAYELCEDTGQYLQVPCVEGQVCERGECITPIDCEPFEVDSCTDCRTYQGCSPTGNARGEYVLNPNQVCVEDELGARIEETVCTPNSTRCTDESSVEACDACGFGYQFARDCFGEDETTICDLGQCITQCEFIEKRKSYIGCEYWAVDLDNAFVPAGGGQFIDADGKPFAVVVSNPSANIAADITVTKFDPVTLTDVVEWSGTVQPGELEVIPLHFYENASDREGIPLSDIQGTMIGYESFKVSSTVPIVAYQFNPLDNETVYSNDASLLFPTSSLGTNYWVMTRRQTFDILKAYVTVVATLPGATEVTLSLPPRTLENPLVTLAGVDADNATRVIPALEGGDVLTVTLQQGQILNLETNRPGADLTGTRVQSNRPVAVFGGAEAANAPTDDRCVYRVSRDDWVCEATRLSVNPTPCVNDNGEPDITRCSDYITCCADHIEHQMLPVNVWGRNFNATRSQPRGDEADTWRVLAANDNTTVTLLELPATWPLPGMLPTASRREVTLNAGEWFEFQSPVDFEIASSGPIMVGQFLSAEFAPYPQSIDAQQPPHSDAGTGDPAFILAVPVEQYRDEYTFLAPSGFEFDYVTVTAPVLSTIILDGEEIPAEEWNDFGRGDYHAARLLVPDGVHTITGDAPFGIMVHGYDSFVSYGFAGGLNLEDISGR